MARVTPSNSARMTYLVGINLILMLLLLVMVVSAGLYTTNVLHNSIGWTEHTYQVEQKFREMRSLLLKTESQSRGFIMTDRAEMASQLEENRKAILGMLGDLNVMVADNPSQVSRVAEIERLTLRRLDDIAQSVRLHQAGKNLEAQTLIGGEGRQAMADVETRVDEGLATEAAFLRQRQASTLSAENALVAVLIIGTVLLALAGLKVYTMLVARLAPLSQAVAQAMAISVGDLSSALPAVRFEDEVGQLVIALNTMQQGLQGLVKRTLTASGGLGAASQQILSAIRQQALTSQEQAAAVQETVITMQELSQSASQVAERAREVATTANITTAASASGQEAVLRSVTATQLIREQAEAVARDILALSTKTQAVGDIVNTVNDLAERSNLLALNASILAATAGSDARGFAVVASEMKALALSSKDATVEVRVLLGDIQSGINRSVMLVEESVKRVESGSQNMKESDKSIRKLTESIEESVTSVQQITAATNQQQLAIEQVTTALLSIRQASDQSELGTRQLEIAASNLTELAAQLQEAIGLYRLPDDYGAVRKARP